jgi:hypothetical protein
MPTNIRADTRPAMKRRFQREIIHELRELGSTRSPPKTNNSSDTKGIERASAKGHPTIAPVAKSIVAYKVLRLFLMLDGSSEYVNAIVVAYIAKEEGRRAMWVLSQNEDFDENMEK